MVKQTKYRAIDPDRRILESSKTIKSLWGEPTIIRGSRVIKQGDAMDAKKALTLQYAHKIAKEALSDMGIEVPQFKIINSNPKKYRQNVSWFSKMNRALQMILGGPPIHEVEYPIILSKTKFNVKRSKGGRVLVTKRFWQDKFSQNYQEAPWAYDRENNERFPASLMLKIEGRLAAAGLQFTDIRPKNFAISKEGKRVLFDVLHDKEGRILGAQVPDSIPNSKKIEQLIAEYQREMKILDDYKTELINLRKKK
ncbi:hypothetical protein HY989_05705 [Candidatus Micrarchaeota archaeon]|nr:hypothetical protein [Candidatus Micrarchaeota archaeon]